MKKVSFMALTLILTSCANNSLKEERTPSQVTDVGSVAQNSYQYYQKQISKAQTDAEQSVVQNKDADAIAEAYMRLAHLQAEARTKGHTCDIAYLSDTISSYSTSLNYSNPEIKSMTEKSELYKSVRTQSLYLQMVEKGFVKGKFFSKSEIVKLMDKILSESSFSIYKWQQGAMPEGKFDFNKNTAKRQYLDQNQIKLVYDPKILAASFVIDSKGRALLVLKNGISYLISFTRNEKEVQKNILSTDSIRFQLIQKDGSVSKDQFGGELHLAPDECSA